MSTEQAADSVAANTTVGDSATVDNTPSKPPRLRLYEVERAVSPLRRVVAYAARQPDAVRYMEHTAQPWLLKLAAFPLPEAVAIDIAEMSRQLLGIDTLDAEERLTRIGELNALISRVDALLGLPLDVLKFRRSNKRLYPRQQQELEPAPPPVAEQPVAVAATASDVTPVQSAPTGQKRTRVGRSAAPHEAVKAREPVVEAPKLPSGPWWLGEGISAVALTKRGLPKSWTEQLASAGVLTGTDLLRLKPCGYESIRPVHGAGMEFKPGRVAVGGRVRSRFTMLRPDSQRHSEVIIRGAGPARLVWSEQLPAVLFESLVPGERVVGIGEHTPVPGAMQRLEQVELTATHTAKVADLAQYGLPGVPDRLVRGAFRAIRADLDELRDPLSESVLTANGLVGLGEALGGVHGAGTSRKAGHKRLAFEEGMYAQLGLALTEQTAPAASRGIAHPILHQLATRLTTWRDVEIDDAHLSAFEVIKRDLRQARPMLRLLAGRPGDERESVALLCAATIAESKSQVLWLVPDAVTAEALFTLYEPMLRELGLVARLLTDDPSRSVRDALRRGEVHILFGTLSLAKAKLQLRRLGLVIAQESEPGEVDRSTFATDGNPVPDVLVVPTRAIGAGHLLGPYAEHAVSWVKPTRWPRFHTVLVPASQREEAYQQVLESIRGGAQALIALPMGKSGDLLEPEEAVRVRTSLERHLPDVRIQLFHGALSREERNGRYEDFQRRRFEVLLATHAVEYGPIVPGATELVVEQADRMPRERLARLLHRLVGLSGQTVRLIHGDDPDPAGMEVLEKLRRGRIDDALAPVPFETSEPKLSWLQPSRNVDLLLAARRVALDALAKDPTLSKPTSVDLARSLALWWPSLFSADCPVNTPTSEPGGASRRRRRRRRRR